MCFSLRCFKQLMGLILRHPDVSGRVGPWAVPTVILLLCCPGSLWSSDQAEKELVAARQLFETNLYAIRSKDRAAYLKTYLAEPGLVRTGPSGDQ